ncbi:MAG TPA: TRP-like protein [Polyangiaceae bacterium]|nr:TRP-like protein [Polyangiaceae bacterium]
MALAMNPGAGGAPVRADVLVLLREKRYEEALARLYQARAENPDSVELQKSLDQVKEFLIGAYAKRLGGLDQVPVPVPATSGRSPDVILLSRYIDGASSYGDIAEMCPLGRLRTLQVLIEIYSPRAVPGGSATPHSERRPVDTSSALPEPLTLIGPSTTEEPAPETARSASSVPPAEPDDPSERAYREAFARGTAAFIQRRFADAVDAFQACAALRPGDAGAEVMLRRARRDLESL